MKGQGRAIMAQEQLRFVHAIGTCLLALCSVGCAVESSSSQATVSGTATYRERMALPPDAVFEATIENVSRADAPSEVIGRTRIESPGLPPIRFTIAYDPARISAGNRYAVRARIARGEQLLFTTDTRYPVLGEAQLSHVDVMLQRVGGSFAASQSPGNASLENTDWELNRVGDRVVTPGPGRAAPFIRLNSADKRATGSGGCNQFTGTYTLEGDWLNLGQMAATMMACMQGMEDESAFFDALKNVNAWRMAGQQLELVDSSGKVVATLSAKAPPPSAKPGLGGTSWQLVQFQSGDGTTLTPDDRTKYTIAFNVDGSLAARIDCNRGRGAWKSSGPNQLELGPLALTRAACPPGSLHDHIVKQWPYVRSYVLKDGRLFLSLMADGGIYEFEPSAAAPSQ
jgi:putative lipoprotein